MRSSIRISPAHGATVSFPSDAEVLFNSACGPRRLSGLTPGLASAFKVMAEGGATVEQLASLVRLGDGVVALSKLHYYLRQLFDAGALRHTLFLEETPLASLVKFSTTYSVAPPSLNPQNSYELSRFAYCRRDGPEFVLESPLSDSRLFMHDPRALSLLAALAAPACRSSAAACGLPQQAFQQFLDLLNSGGFLTTAGGEADSGESTDPTLRQWEFHDLLFHSRSRQGRHRNPYGGTYRFAGEIPPLPAVRAQPSEETFDLYKPDVGSLSESDLPFTRVLEGRRSAREFGERPLTDGQLGEFLYRSMRVRRLFDGGRHELSDRPYPGGGAVYELEAYPVVKACAGLHAGLYHYCPLRHRLSRVSGLEPAVVALLGAAGEAAGGAEVQVLVILAARFQRVAWKYESVAYSLVLKDVGVLCQTMSLVATAMGLGSCVIGGGDSDLFARAAGTQYLAESSVGEFILGSAPG